jgi:hypothetical protein
MAGKTLLGKLDRGAFGMLQSPRLSGEVLQGFPDLECRGLATKEPA